MAQLERRRSAQERYPSLCLRIPTRPALEFWGWGRNDFGQLGLNDEQHRFTPVHLESLDNKDLVHLAGGSFNSGFLTDDGEVYLSGVNDSGQLAFKTPSTRLTPTRVTALETFRITHLSMGVGHSLAVTERGQLLTWGLNDNGQLGYTTSESSPIPRLVTGVRDLIFVRVAAGSAHSLALTSCGSIYSAGQGTFGALGHGVEEDLMEFKLLRGLFGFGVIQVECGEFHSAALTSDGKVWTWGRGRHGQLGLGTTENAFLPIPISTLSPHKIKQVACGDSHTLCVTKDGRVFAWGQSRWGQTGTNSIEDILFPKLLESLSEEYITQVAAGSRHSAVLTLRGMIFVFGNHELGQLGVEISSTFSPVPIPVEGLPGFPVICILAKGDHNVVMFDKTPGSLAGMANGRYGLGMMPFKVPDLEILLKEVEKNQKTTNEQLVTLLRALDDIFESPGFLLEAFMPPGKTSEITGLNTVKINEIYGRIFRSYDEKAILQVGIASGKLLTQILETGHTFPEILHDRSDRWIPVILIIMLNPVFGETLASGGEMVIMISAILDFMRSSEKQSLRRYLNELPVEVFGGKVVKGVQKHLTNMAKNHDSINHPISGQKRQELFKICTLLSLFYEVNEERQEKIQFEHFYNNEVSDGLELITEFLNWVSTGDQDSEAIPSICQFPFILTPDVKAKITYGEALFRKQATMQSNQFEALIHGIHPGRVSFLDVRIRRDHLREDAVTQLLHRSSEFQKPLRVTFLSNGVEEEGEDEGGLSKEFFQLLIEEIFNVDFGMFVYNEETRDYWFSTTAFDVEDFHLVGTVLGLAIYNKVILDVHFPLVVYKKLMQLPTNFQDLKTAFPELAKGLQQLLDFEGDVESVFLRTFEIEYESFGERVKEELKPGGASIPVTNENRVEYVDLYTHYILEESISGPFDAFAKGFWRVCGSQSMTLFRYEELELLICGLPHLDFHDLERVTLYDGGYTPTSRVIQDFWSVLHELSLKDKKKFLFFVTGCDRAPVGGLSKLKFIIQRSGPDTNRLPTSHTCFNILLLPEYNSKAKMKDRLMVAIHNAQGFGLQ